MLAVQESKVLAAFCTLVDLVVRNPSVLVEGCILVICPWDGTWVLEELFNVGLIVGVIVLIHGGIVLGVAVIVGRVISSTTIATKARVVTCCSLIHVAVVLLLSLSRSEL